MEDGSVLRIARARVKIGQAADSTLYPIRDSGACRFPECSGNWVGMSARAGHTVGMVEGSASAELRDAVARLFGFGGFRPGQAEAMTRVLDGQDVVVIMPTGSGKSLCYQVPAMLQDGVSLVISPLIALMQDQVNGLAARGLPATFLNSSLSFEALRHRLDQVRQGRYKLVYVAPERFRSRAFLDVLDEVRVSMIAIDEAHCISQWGHDFRPDYLRLRQVVDRWGEARVMALTATATPDVRDDVVRQLGLGEGTRRPPAVLVHGFARPNLHLAVTRAATHADKLRRVLDLCRPQHAGLVYAATRKQAERVHAKLRRAVPTAGLYHAGLPDEDRRLVQEAFLSGGIPVVVATNAFGMGVDRADLRFVAHWDIPGSLEAYYQEIGRAGRDGRPAQCDLLYNFADVRTQRFFLEGANPSPDMVSAVWRLVRASCLEGAVAQSDDRWTELAGGVANPMAVRSILALLERCGLISREPDPGTRAFVTRLNPGADESVLQGQFRLLDEKRLRDERKLKAMIHYAQSDGCRHAHLLRYFGEPDVEDVCGACDRCVRLRPEEGREPDEAQWLAIQKILSCAARMHGRFGVGRLAQVLTGSRAGPVLENQLDRLPTYGILSGMQIREVRRFIDVLLDRGALRIASGDYPVVELTPRGREVMWRRETLRAPWPRTATVPRPSGRSQSPDEHPPGASPDLVRALSEWRRRTAAAARVPAYCVLHNKTLEAIAAAHPDSLAALEAVHGMGPSRVARYGHAILKILDTARAPPDPNP